MKISLRLWQGARPRRAGVQCEKTEAAIQEPIAAPAWPRYGTRPPFTNLCDLRAVRAAGGGFRRRRGAPCAGRCTLGRLFGLRGAARPRARRYAIAHGIRDKVYVTNSWQHNTFQPYSCTACGCSVPKSGAKHTLWCAEHTNCMLGYFESTCRMMLNLT